LENKRFEVRCPALWADIDTFEESTYDETIKIVKGVGYCNNPDSAQRLANFGYTIRDLYIEKEKQYDEQRESKTDSGGSTKQTIREKGSGRKKTKI
jgi:hypothetical protein